METTSKITIDDDEKHDRTERSGEDTISLQKPPRFQAATIENGPGHARRIYVLDPAYSHITLSPRQIHYDNANRLDLGQALTLLELFLTEPK
jgi:hypothetical protein